MSHLKTIIILGYPRSGTTWFANLFNTHPDVVYRHEVIGRCHQEFPKKLFKKLKFDYSLTETEYRKLVHIILSPNVESDRAPFFKKNHLTLNHPKLHYISWLASKAIPFFRPLYKYMFFPKGLYLKLVIKETRSTMNMDSIIEGIRSDKNIILFRHPCGTIASSLKGIETGKMQPSSKAEREHWFDENKNRDYITTLSLNPSQILSLPEHEYLALRWRLQNEDYLELSTKNSNNIYINYEDFMIDQEVKVKGLFAKLSLSYDPGVENFILSSSGVKNSKPLLKDSSSNFYSVYQSEGFDPNKWKNTLETDQISGIEKHTLDIFDKLLEYSSH